LIATWCVPGSTYRRPMQAWRNWWLIVGSALGAASAGCINSEASAPNPSAGGLSDLERGEDTTYGARSAAEHGAARDSMPVRVRFRASVGESSFACDQSYAASGAVGGWLTPVDLRFFVGDVRFTTADGLEQPLSLELRAPWQLEDVALLDFEDGTGACQAGTREVNVELTGWLPPGDYVALSFENGVPEALNHADPAAQPPPLQPGGMHWGWLLGYRFLVAEVAGEQAPGGESTGSALFHLGSTDCSGAIAGGGVVCKRPNRNRVRLEGFDLAADEVVVDVLRLFDGMDLNRVTTCHSGGGEECSSFFERVGIDAVDGAAHGEQTLFRVEPARREP
jgi:uncharacterized repeat protein (TIGR04052 family)